MTQKILSRQEFADMVSAKGPGLGGDDSPLWEPERMMGGTKSAWFVCIKPLDFSNYSKKDKYWAWCSENLQGTVRCYISGDSEEWWGFSSKNDIFLWSLRWI